jgi:surfeit locus 1 family protein
MTSSEAAPGGWRRIRPAPALVVLLATALLCGLGVWQVQRLGQKTRQLNQIAALQTAPPEPLSVVLNRLGDRGQVDFVRAQTLCPGLQQSPAVRLYAVIDGQMGRRLITACPIAAGPYRSILVDRGFVVQEQLGQVRPGPVLDTPVVGVLRRPDGPGWLTPANRPAENDWRWRDIAGMAAALHASAPAPVMLMLERPAPAGVGPRPEALPAEIPNNHLGYALTWFGLAIALVAIWIASLRQPRQSQSAPQ